MKITLYQIIPELDTENLIFQDFLKKRDGQIPAEIYEIAFHGDLAVQTPEDVFMVFNLDHPEGYRGRSMSVADVVEFIYSPEHSDFFFCNSAGFTKVYFDKKRAMCPIVNHDYLKVEDIREGDFEIVFYGEFGIQLARCYKISLTRCRYSRCQLGYKLTYSRSKEGRPKEMEFLNKPKILLIHIDGHKSSISVLYHKADERTYTRRYADFDDENFKAIERWCQTHTIPFEYLLDTEKRD